MICWVISDGRRGIENQALGLAEALADIHPLTLIKQTISNRPIFKALPPRMQFFLKHRSGAYFPSNLDQSAHPKIAIGCGRQAIAPLMALKKKLGPNIFTVYIQDPHIDPKNFDCVVAPQHDNLKGENIINIIGSPNRITLEKLSDAKAQARPLLDSLKGSQNGSDSPQKFAVFLIGGPSSAYTLTPNSFEKHKAAILEAAHAGFTILLTVSRRTPEAFAKQYQSLCKTLLREPLSRKSLFISDSNSPELRVTDFDASNITHPYFAWLGAADMLFVTEESTNMLTESCATGVPVITLPMTIKNKRRAQKFERLHNQLKARCDLKAYQQGLLETLLIASGSKKPDPLNETRRAAKEIWLSL